MQQRNSALKICLPWNNSIRTLMRQLQKGESANLLTLRDVALCKKTNATTAPDSRRNLAREQRQRDLKNVVPSPPSPLIVKSNKECKSEYYIQKHRMQIKLFSPHHLLHKMLVDLR